MSNYIGAKSEENIIMTDRNIIKSSKNLFLKKIIRNNNINNIKNMTSYTFNNINNSSYIKMGNNNNINKNKTNINGYNFKDRIISPIKKKINKKINLNGNNKLILFEESKNGNLSSQKKKI